jgi:DNA-directed RNA polymerase subunit RPC12/RpoP
MEGVITMAETVEFKCMRCGHEWEGAYDPEEERTYPKCRSNSVRVFRFNSSNHFSGSQSTTEVVTTSCTAQRLHQNRSKIRC